MDKEKIMLSEFSYNLMSVINNIESNVTMVSSALEDIAINVKNLGAKGDGVVDDTIVIQNALNTGKSVYLPQGVYRVTQPLKMSSQKVSGAGPSGTSKYLGLGQTQILIDHNGNGLVYDYNHANAVFSGGLLENIMIRLNDSQINSTAYGIHVFSWNHLTFRNVSICQFINGEGVKFEGNSGQYSLIDDCKFFKNKIGVHGLDYNGVHLVDCMFDANDNGSKPNTQPTDGTIGVLIQDSADTWKLVNSRFQGIETTIDTVGQYTLIDNCRFEMFTTGVKLRGVGQIYRGGSFNNYNCGGGGICISVESTANGCIIEPFVYGSVVPVPVRNSGVNTMRKDSIVSRVFVPLINKSISIPVLVNKDNPKMVSNAKFVYQGMNTGTTWSNRWNVSIQNRIGFIESYLGIGWKANQVIPICEEATNDTGTAIAPGSIVNVIFSKNGTAVDLTNIYIEVEFVPY